MPSALGLVSLDLVLLCSHDAVDDKVSTAVEHESKVLEGGEGEHPAEDKEDCDKEEVEEEEEEEDDDDDEDKDEGSQGDVISEIISDEGEWRMKVLKVLIRMKKEMIKIMKIMMKTMNTMKTILDICLFLYANAFENCTPKSA